MLLCAPRFSAAFVGLKGPAASRGAHSRDTSFGGTAVSARPEARSPQSHCTLQPVFHRQLGSMAQTAEPEQPSVPAPKGLLPPPRPIPTPSQSEKMRADPLPLPGGNWTGFKELLRPGEAASLNSFVQCLQRHLHLFALGETAPKAR